MKLSTKIRYGTRMMLELALRYGEGPVLLKEICKSQEVSLKYLSQLVIPLKIAGLVNSSRGFHGGYYLSKTPDKIRLSEIVTALEGPVNLVECIIDPNICNRSEKCATKDIWDEIGKKYFEILDSYTLEQITGLHKAKQI